METTMNQETVGLVKVGLAILCITILEGVAMITGVDGKMLGLAFAAIAGLGGYGLSELLQARRNGGE